MRGAQYSVQSNGRDTCLGIETIKQQSNQQSRQKDTVPTDVYFNTGYSEELVKG